MLYYFCTHSAYNTLFSKTAECLNHLTDLLILIKTNVPLYKQLQLHGKQTDLMLCYVMLTQHQPLTPSGRQLVTLTAFHIFKCILISYTTQIIINKYLPFHFLYAIHSIWSTKYSYCKYSTHFSLAFCHCKTFAAKVPRCDASLIFLFSNRTL